MNNELLVSAENGVVLLQLNRPQQRNALSLALLDELAQALAALATQEVSGVVLCGTSTCFSAGADFSDLQGTAADVAMDDAVAAVVAAIGDLSVPVIAALDGYCLGAAVDLVLACDLRLIAKDAWLQVPATRLGLLYNPTAIARLSRNVSADVMFRLLVMGERFEAAEAARIGLVSYAPVAGDVNEQALQLLRTAADNDAFAVAGSKQLLRALYQGNYDPDYWESVRLQTLSTPQRRAAVENAKKR